MRIRIRSRQFAEELAWAERTLKGDGGASRMLGRLMVAVRRLVYVAWVGVAGANAQPATASALAASPPLGATAAEAIIAGCKAHAAAKRQSHAIVVLDAGANVVASLRMDGNLPGVMAFAHAKARAAANWGLSTLALHAAVMQTDGFGAAPDIVTVAGGVPIFAQGNSQLLGAVGVSGESPADDTACAEAGIRAAGLLPARTG